MKKTGILSVILITAIMLCACDKEETAAPTAETTTMETAAIQVNDNTTIAEGALYVGIYPDNSKFVTQLEDGSVEGYCIDLANAIGNLTLLDVKFVMMEQKDLYAELDTSLYDCIISANEKTEIVDKVYDFSNVYLTDENGTEYAIVTKTGNNRLLNLLNEALMMLKKDGTLDELWTKWFVEEEVTSEDESGTQSEE